MEAAAGRPALVLAVDLPLVPVRLLSRLVDRLPGFDAVVPASNGGPEPLAALYGTGCLDPIRRRLAAGDLAATAFWPDVVVYSLPPTEYADLGDPDTLFLNVNVSDDYERARMIAPGSSPSSRRSGRGGRGL